MITKVISGGQTGVDQMGLRVAKSLGIPTGGTAAKGWMTELGPYPSLATDYGLVECTKSGYPPRTEQNVKDADFTVLFGNSSSPGSQLTLQYIKQHNKPSIINPNSAELAHLLDNLNVQVLNVAGNRGGKLGTKKLLEYSRVLTEALKINVVQSFK